MIRIRPVNLSRDRQQLLELDRSFVTDRVYHVVRTDASFMLQEAPVEPPLRKELPLEYDLGAERAWEDGLVGDLDGEIVGFAAWKHEVWNRRTVLWHLYVEANLRGRGVGRELVARVIERARDAGMRAVWLETSSVNYPAIAFYRRLGFTLDGLDLSLYDPSGSAAGETALYFALPLEKPSRGGS
jgi:ribosomal protein S18 acetylase RimI-like enzyme